MFIESRPNFLVLLFFLLIHFLSSDSAVPDPRSGRGWCVYQCVWAFRFSVPHPPGRMRTERYGEIESFDIFLLIYAPYWCIWILWNLLI